MIHAVLLLYDRMPLLPITVSAAAHVAYLQVTPPSVALPITDTHMPAICGKPTPP